MRPLADNLRAVFCQQLIHRAVGQGRVAACEVLVNSVSVANIIRDGWVFTGDRGYMDEDGYFHVLDRIKNVIKRAGENIAAPEVEKVIAAHHKIKDVVVIAAPDPIRDEAMTAFIVVKDGQTCTEEDIIAWCSQRLAKFKIPSFIKFRGSLPRDGTGAVAKDILKREITTQ